MKRSTLPLVLAVLAAGLLAGCSTVESRIKEKSAVFSALDPQTQQKLRKSVVEVGYSPDMVYIALGTPDQKHGKKTAKGYEETWVYNTYYDEWAGQVLTHYRRFVSYDPTTRRYFVYYEPVYSDLYQERTEERFRVDFRNGKVTAVEQAKDAA
jgi:hypothetical protein